MPSETQVHTTLSKEDYRLLKIAKDLYKEERGKLLREIIHAWIFSNKAFLIQNENNQKRKS